MDSTASGTGSMIVRISYATVNTTQRFHAWEVLLPPISLESNGVTFQGPGTHWGALPVAHSTRVLW